MASSVPLLPPERFDFAHPDTWPRWITRFERYRVAAGLSDKDEPVQVCTLMYAMGEEAEDILASFGLNEEDRKKYDVVRERFAKHFVKQRNPIYERARFNQRAQQQGETVDAFVMALHTLSEHCEYGELRSQMIRDRLVVGLLDANLSEKLQLEADLKLESAVARARNNEAVKSQQPTIRGSATTPSVPPTAVDALHSRSKNKQPHRSTRSTGNTWSAGRQQARTLPTRKCGWCGREQHPRERCSARNAKCKKCTKLGHYAAVCRSTSSSSTAAVSVVKAEEVFLGSVQSGSVWTKQILVNDKLIEMKVDTGADVTAIPETTYRRILRSTPRLSKPERILRGPDGKELSLLGQFRAEMSTTTATNHQSQQTIYVVRGLRLPLLGRPALQDLQVFSRVDTVLTNRLTGSEINHTFPSLFTGLGKFTGPPH